VASTVISCDLHPRFIRKKTGSGAATESPNDSSLGLFRNDNRAGSRTSTAHFLRTTNCYALIVHELADWSYRSKQANSFQLWLWTVNIIQQTTKSCKYGKKHRLYYMVDQLPGSSSFTSSRRPLSYESSWPFQWFHWLITAVTSSPLQENCTRKPQPVCRFRQSPPAEVTALTRGKPQTHGEYNSQFRSKMIHNLPLGQKKMKAPAWLSTLKVPTNHTSPRQNIKGSKACTAQLVQFMQPSMHTCLRHTSIDAHSPMRATSNTGIFR
jgi:hypothetical protein